MANLKKCVLQIETTINQEQNRTIPLVQFGNNKMPKISQTLSPILSLQLSQIETTIKSKIKHYGYPLVQFGKHKSSYLIIKN